MDPQPQTLYPHPSPLTPYPSPLTPHPSPLASGDKLVLTVGIPHGPLPYALGDNLLVLLDLSKVSHLLPNPSTPPPLPPDPSTLPPKRKPLENRSNPKPETRNSKHSARSESSALSTSRNAQPLNRTRTPLPPSFQTRKGGGAVSQDRHFARDARGHQCSVFQRLLLPPLLLFRRLQGFIRGWTHGAGLWLGVQVMSSCKGFR
jgi:hypothetical protein